MMSKPNEAIEEFFPQKFIPSFIIEGEGEADLRQTLEKTS